MPTYQWSPLPAASNHTCALHQPIRCSLARRELMPQGKAWWSSQCHTKLPDAYLEFERWILLIIRNPRYDECFRSEIPRKASLCPVTSVWYPPGGCSSDAVTGIIWTPDIYICKVLPLSRRSLQFLARQLVYCFSVIIKSTCFTHSTTYLHPQHGNRI